MARKCDARQFAVVTTALCKFAQTEMHCNVCVDLSNRVDVCAEASGWQRSDGFVVICKVRTQMRRMRLYCHFTSFPTDQINLFVANSLAFVRNVEVRQTIVR